MTSNEVVVRHDGMAAKVQYAEKLANSGLLPSDYRRNPANVLYAVEYGEMLGLSPMAAITGIHVIDGKPTASASLISALVRRAGHRLRVTGDANHAVAEIVRSDDPDFTFKSEWNLERAAAAGLVEVKNGKPFARDTKGRPKPWEKYPAAMLKARAITEAARDACEEALSGVHYTPEELGASVDEDGIPVTVESVRDEIDWEGAIEEAGADVIALKNLYKRARDIYGSSNPELAARITAAGKAAAEATAAPAEPVIDAELVEDAPAEGVPVVTESSADAPAETGADVARKQIGNLVIAQHSDLETVKVQFKAQYGQSFEEAPEPELRAFQARLLASVKEAA